MNVSMLNTLNPRSIVFPKSITRKGKDYSIKIIYKVHSCEKSNIYIYIYNLGPLGKTAVVKNLGGEKWRRRGKKTCKTRTLIIVMTDDA